MTLRPLPAVVAIALLGAGCGDTQLARRPSTAPDKPPTAAEVDQIRSAPATPLFWLGRSYGGRPLTRAKLSASDPPDAIFQYGPPTCEAGAGCSYELGVATLRKRAPDATQRCWRRLGPALVLGCDDSRPLQVFTGPVEVFVVARPTGAARVARALRVKHAGTSAGPPLDGLAAPQRFSCADVTQLPADASARLPAQLRPPPC